VLKKFKALPTLKKTAITLALIVAFFILAPLTVKYVSAGEIDLFALVQQLFTRVDEQEARIAELEEKLEELEGSKEQEEPAPQEPGEPGSSEGGGTGSGSNGGGTIPPSGDNPGDSPGDSPPLEPEPEPEPEPWPALAKIDYVLTPQRSDSGRMVYRFEGTKLYCDFYEPKPGITRLTWDGMEEETEYAFTEIIDLVEAWERWESEGIAPMLKEQLPVNVIINPQRIGDTMKFDLLNWYGKDAPYEVRFPERQAHILLLP